MPWIRRGIRRALTAEPRDRSNVGSCGMCGEKIDAGTSFCPITSVFPCQYYSSIAAYSLTHIPPTWHYINANNQYHVPTVLILQKKLQVQIGAKTHFDA
jgi:hypothetical protein